MHLQRPAHPVETGECNELGSWSGKLRLIIYKLGHATYPVYAFSFGYM